MRIKDVAKLIGTSTQALRYYERLGLIEAPIRDSSGYRFYSDRSVKVLRLIKEWQGFGFKLSEIRSINALLKEPNVSERARKVSELAISRLSEIDAEIDKLQRQRMAVTSLFEQSANFAAALSER